MGIVPGVGEIKHGWEEKQLWADRMRLFNWLHIENIPAQRSPCTLLETLADLNLCSTLEPSVVLDAKSRSKMRDGSVLGQVRWLGN